MDAIAQAAEQDFRAKPGGYRVKFNLQDADLSELVNHIAGMTGRRFIYGQKVRQVKVTVVSPEPVTLDEAYQAFLAILQSNGMTVIPHGRFLKIVDSAGVVTDATPIYDRAAPVPDAARYVTRLYRLQHVSATEVVGVLNKFKSKEGDVTSYEPGQLLIMTDTGTNIQRMIRLIEEMDVGGAGSQMWVEPVNNGSADELAKRITDTFGVGPDGASGISKVTSDPQTNSLIIVGQEDAYLRVLELVKRLDVKPSAGDKVQVLALQHANAEDLANTLTQMLNTAAGKNKGAPGQGQGSSMFEGDVKVTADKATNSLLVTASARDFASLRLVIGELDLPRRQVFIEAVIMDLSVSDTNKLGTSWHGGLPEDIGGGGDTLFVTGFHAQDSLLFPPNQDMLQAFAVGARGPDLSGTSNLTDTGLSIPAFGVVLHAMTTSGRTNVLATPHIIATDNTPAEINIGENIPLQENMGGGMGNMGNLASLSGLASGQNASNLGALGGMGMMGMMGMGFNAPRQDVGNKIKVVPHINDSNQVRLEIEQESSAKGAATGTLGVVSIVKRTANTTVTVDDQQTVVIGGLMRDEVVQTDQKIPLLGDIPVLGFLFKHSTTEKRKANLLLILTPYIIRDQNDLRKIFQRKMQERQEFLDRYFVFNGQDWQPPQDFSRANGLVEDIRQAYFRADEQTRLRREAEGAVPHDHEPGEPIALPQGAGSSHPKGGQPGAVPVTPPATRPAQAPAEGRQGHLRLRGQMPNAGPRLAMSAGEGEAIR